MQGPCMNELNHYRKDYESSLHRNLHFFPPCLFLLSSPRLPLAEEQAQQRLQAEEAEEQYQTVLHLLNTTTRKTQKKE